MNQIYESLTGIFLDFNGNRRKNCRKHFCNSILDYPYMNVRNVSFKFRILLTAVFIYSDPSYSVRKDLTLIKERVPLPSQDKSSRTK